MDRDDNSQNTSSNAGKGIYSTPNLTVNAENLSQHNTENTKSRVAAFFSSTDASQQAQKLDHAMSSPEQAQLSTEDIVIKNNQKKHSKFPIIVAVAAVMLVIIGGVVVLALNGNSEQSSTTPDAQTSREAQQEFIYYATYLLNGESSNELTGEYTPGKAYKLDVELEQPSNSNREYWTKSNDLLQKSIDSYASVSNNDTFLLQFLRSHQQNLVFLDTYHRISLPSDSEIISRYISDGASNTKAYLSSLLSSLTDLDSAIARQYATAKEQQYDAVLGMLGIYSEAGCIQNGEMNNGCVSNVLSTRENEISAFGQSKMDNEQNAEQLISQTVRMIESNCWQINSQFNENNSSTQEGQ